MKEQTVFIQPIQKNIQFIIGQNQTENFSVLDLSGENDIWFHANDKSSCHVTCKVPENMPKKELKYLIKMGAVLCKQNTNKLKSLKNIEIIYAPIKNVSKTNIAGQVHATNTKTIVI